MTGTVNDIEELYKIIDGRKVNCGQAPRDYAIKRNKRMNPGKDNEILKKKN